MENYELDVGQATWTKVVNSGASYILQNVGTKSCQPYQSSAFEERYLQTVMKQRALLSFLQS